MQDSCQLLSQPAEGAEHPRELVEADRRYLVPWGLRTCLWVLAGTAVLAGLVVALAVQAAAWALLLLPVLILGAFLVLFFRNPSRRIPAGPGILVAPADGTVWDVTVVDEPEFVKEPCYRIGIFLSIFNVHLNRSPGRGRVDWVELREGSFHDARSPRASTENASNAIGMVLQDDGAPGGLRVLVRQISGAVARRIVCPLRPPVHVARGGLVGMIKYGSRTELFVPLGSGVEVRVRVGEKVRAGSTIVAAWPQGTGGSPAAHGT